MRTMASNEMKDLWKIENKELEDKVNVNEALLRSSAFDKAATDYEKLLTLSIWGRNLALVYCVISVVYAIRIFNAYVYSIPALLGALAMLWSFTSHLSLKRISFERLSIIELQKSIHAFRVHTNKMKLYDFSIVVFWLLTLTPAWILSNWSLALYENPKTMLIFFGLAAVLVIIVFLVTRMLYRDYNNKLQDAEQALEHIKEFEKSEIQVDSKP